MVYKLNVKLGEFIYQETYYLSKDMKLQSLLKVRSAKSEFWDYSHPDESYIKAKPIESELLKAMYKCD